MTKFELQCLHNKYIRLFKERNNLNHKDVRKKLSSMYKRMTMELRGA